ncbi:MAG: FecR domain-containing protein [Myxococcota bacterium]|nr:FecR domain-containing protein [Myxococcota bacterium]
MTLKQAKKSTFEIPAPALVQLVHAKRGRMSSQQRIEGAHILVGRLKWGHRRRWRPFAPLLAAGLVVSIACVALVAVERRAGTALSYAIDDGHVERGGFIQADSARQPRLRFSDGSEVLLTPAAKASLTSVDNRGARLSLSEGSARVDVVHKPQARWLFDAGPFQIAVTGTSFTVGWKSAEEQLDVRMERGTVEVTSPLSEGAIRLRSGQHLIVRVRQRETRIVDLEDSASTTSEPATTAVGSTEPDRSRSTGVRSGEGRTGVHTTPMPAGRDWAAQLANGDFESIVRQAEHMGLDACLAESTSSDLASLSDAARYGRHDDIARRALLAQRHRFPLSASARDACFLLGRLDETGQNLRGAIEWYDRYLTENPSGTYSPEALGRTMNLAQKLYGNERARVVARQYLSRFPQGMYAASARTLSQLQ